MNKEKTYTESAFDEIFKNKDIIEYKFDNNSSKMSRRDMQIIKHLTAFGIRATKCLDVCPGTGRWLNFFKQHQASYVAGIDISQEVLNKCSPLCDKIQRVDVEKEKFDFESDFFDVVTSFMVLEHIRNPKKYISELIRVTKKGGIILMTIPNIVSFLSRVRVVFGKLPIAVASDKTHIKFYTEDELIKLFIPFNLRPEVLPTSFSLNPFNPMKFRIPSNRMTKSLDDHILFMIKVLK